MPWHSYGLFHLISLALYILGFGVAACAPVVLAMGVRKISRKTAVK